MAATPIKILMLDDDEDEFLIVKRLLSKAPSAYVVDWTASVEVALADMSRGEHEVYLVDYRMGMVTGLDVIDRAVRAGVRAPVILLTAATPAEDGSDIDIQALRSGAADYLSKNELTSDTLERSVRYARERAASVMLREDLWRAEETGTKLRAALQEVERQATRLRLLAEASHVFAQAPSDVDATLEEVVRRCAETLGDACFATLLVEDRSRGVIRAVRHVDPSVHAFGLATLRGADVDLDSSVSGRVIRDGQPRLLSHLHPGQLQVTQSEPAQRFHARYPVSSALFVPLRASGEILGTLTLMRTRPGKPYTDEDQTLLQDIADRAALAIKNAALFAAELAANERERAARREAEAANRAKDEFLAMLGHELRNPLAPILTAVHLLELRGGPETARELAVLRRQSQHLVRLVDDLLDVSRIARGKVALNREVVELADVVAAAIELSRPVIDSGRHALVLDLPRSGLPVNVDRVRFAQAISNLLANAAKYTEKGGCITVTARAVSEEVVLTVQDNGAGIAPDLLPRIFDLFVQSPQTLNRAKGGLGLGLSIVKNMIAMHAGTVSAESPGPGKGSTFTIRVPLARAAELALADGAASDRPSVAATGRGRVLVVDDNKDAAEMLAEALGTMGYRAATAHDAPEALRIADDFLPDIGLLDIGLPVVDGYDLARQLLDRHANLRLVAVSGYGLEADKRRAREAGFIDHLTKPVELDSLAKMLTEVAAGG